jgi:hypothetical protein
MGDAAGVGFIDASWLLPRQVPRAVMTAVVGGVWLREIKDVDITLGSGVEAARRA